MTEFLDKIKVIFEDELKKKNEEIVTLKKELFLQREKLEDVALYIKDKLYDQRSTDSGVIDGARGARNPFEPTEAVGLNPVVRGFPSRAAGDPDDPYDSIRR